jgi:pimeloyl-ACP methyl ester carboxylesterase
MTTIRNIVLVHGGFVDGSGWQDVYDELTRNGQVPWGVDGVGGAVTEPAWRHKPSWYLVATEDRMIPPPAQRMMAERAGAKVVEVIGSHAVYGSQPAAVADLIREAAA